MLDLCNEIVQHDAFPLLSDTNANKLYSSLLLIRVSMKLTSKIQTTNKLFLFI